MMFEIRQTFILPRKLYHRGRPKTSIKANPPGTAWQHPYTTPTLTSSYKVVLSVDQSWDQRAPSPQPPPGSAFTPFSPHTQQHKTQRQSCGKTCPRRMRSGTTSSTSTLRKENMEMRPKNLCLSSSSVHARNVFASSHACTRPSLTDSIVQKKPPSHHAKKEESPNLTPFLSPKLESVQTPMPDARCFVQASASVKRTGFAARWKEICTRVNVALRRCGF